MVLAEVREDMADREDTAALWVALAADKEEDLCHLTQVFFFISLMIRFLMSDQYPCNKRKQKKEENESADSSCDVSMSYEECHFIAKGD